MQNNEISKNILNFDKLLKRKFCEILKILKGLQNMITMVL